jgi:hypothetical protein
MLLASIPYTKISMHCPGLGNISLTQLAADQYLRHIPLMVAIHVLMAMEKMYLEA